MMEALWSLLGNPWSSHSIQQKIAKELLIVVWKTQQQGTEPEWTDDKALAVFGEHIFKTNQINDFKYVEISQPIKISLIIKHK